jgi:hypothetical protein
MLNFSNTNKHTTCKALNFQGQNDENDEKEEKDENDNYIWQKKPRQGRHVIAQAERSPGRGKRSLGR